MISLSVGLLISTVGTDPIYGAYRFTFGSPILADGIEFLVVMVGAYGVGEVLTRLETGFATKPLDKISNARTELPTLKELNDIKGMFFRSSVVGDLIGLLPGAGATIASFVSYGIEARSASARTRWAPALRRASSRRRRPRPPRLAARWFICLRSAFPAAARPP